MKSLQESLFDNNIKNNLTIRQVYDLHSMQAGGAAIGYLFSMTKLQKYKSPHISTSRIPIPTVILRVIGIIDDLPCPLQKDYNKGKRCEWGKNAIKTLSKYINPYWKLEFDENFQINVKENDDVEDAIDIRLELLDHNSSVLNGYWQFTFTPQSN